jgi:hypothetical protein
MNVERTSRRDAAFCCVGLLFLGPRLDEIVNLLPEGRREPLRRCREVMAGWSREELEAQLRAMRRADMVEAIRRSGPAEHLHLESLPVLLERWLRARAWEADGIEDH